MALLSPGDTFPKLTITVPGGQTLTLPDALAGDFGVVLFYRGSWCPYCNAQLRAFQRSSGALAEAGIRMIALSVDDEATTAELISKHGLRDRGRSCRPSQRPDPGCPRAGRRRPARPRARDQADRRPGRQVSRAAG